MFVGVVKYIGSIMLFFWYCILLNIGEIFVIFCDVNICLIVIMGCFGIWIIGVGKVGCERLVVKSCLIVFSIWFVDCIVIVVE